MAGHEDDQEKINVHEQNREDATDRLKQRQAEEKIIADLHNSQGSETAEYWAEQQKKTQQVRARYFEENGMDTREAQIERNREMFRQAAEPERDTGNEQVMQNNDDEAEAIHENIRDASEEHREFAAERMIERQNAEAAGKEVPDYLQRGDSEEHIRDEFSETNNEIETTPEPAMESDLDSNREMFQQAIDRTQDNDREID